MTNNNFTEKKNTQNLQAICKVLLGVLLLTCFLFVHPAFVSAEEAASKVYTEGTLYYEVVSGTGDSTDTVTITGCFSQDPKVTVPSTIAGKAVTAIAAGAFTECTSVQTVIYPDTCKVDPDAFGSFITNASTYTGAALPGVHNQNRPVGGASGSSDPASIDMDLEDGACCITSQPTDCSVKIGEQATFSVTAENAENYRWYCSRNGETWTALKDGSTISGTKTDTLTFTMTAGRNKYLYRCKITGSDETVYTDAVQNARLTIVTQPESVETPAGQNAVFSCEAENAASYQWYYKKKGDTSWHKLTDNAKKSNYMSGSATASLEFRVTSVRQTFHYRCKVFGTDGTYQYTDSVSVAMQPDVLTQPENQTAVKNTNVTLTVEAENAVSYQWQYRKPGSSAWTKLSDGETLSGSATDTMTLKATSTRLTYTYRCKLTGSDGSVVYTDEVTIK